MSVFFPEVVNEGDLKIPSVTSIIKHEVQCLALLYIEYVFISIFQLNVHKIKYIVAVNIIIILPKIINKGLDFGKVILISLKMSSEKCKNVRMNV